jgi:ribosomal protein S12 methylthiotransferase accessory factor
VAAKVLVPGCEVETMSYGRIGERGVRLLREQDDPLVAIGPDPGGWGRVHLTAEAEERLGGAAWFNRQGARRRVGALYPLYREPGRHVVAQVLAELQESHLPATRLHESGFPAMGRQPVAEGRA